ncbi:YihY/virulence factor BrkB family protein [Methylocystis sp. WRRC1]|uniref:YihY/virulence factor BrkB family protein n=1 Tax=unclassified Methylocystis TaxID=2625913 RepID=UPI0001F873B2|nr:MULTISPECIES: YihY/virulence factor BrkB family protein [unclassified Methylocystis]MCC3244249.1 YihY/virulence factor BrkB family protein [Methylocystis sp. WRRC1]
MFLLRPFYDAYLKFERDDGWAIASHIALSTLTALFPFLIFITALAGFFGRQEVADAAAKIIFEAWPPRIAGPLSAEVQSVLTEPRHGMATIGAVLGIYFASSGVEALRVALNRAYDARDQRPWWWLRLEAIVFVFIGAASLLAIGFLLVLAPLARAIATQHAPALMHELEPLYAPVRYGVTTAVVSVALLAAHVFLPAGQRPLARIVPGFALTLLASLACGALFGAYLAEFAGSYVSTYAGLASIMMALVFLYSLAVIFIYGAELNQVIASNGDTPGQSQG